MPEPLWFPFPTLDDDELEVLAVDEEDQRAWDTPPRELIGVNDPSIVVPDQEHPLEIRGSDGELIFALRADGTAVVHPRRTEEAAAIFWREVIEMAQLLRIPIDVVDQ